MAHTAQVTSEAWPSILSLAAQGDEVAFERIVAAHHADLLRVGQLVAGDPDVAAEAAQRAWAIAWRRLGDVRDPQRLRPWLMSIAANEARQLLRSQGRRRVREIAMWTGESGSGETAVVERIDLISALDRLDRVDRQLLALRYVGGFEAAEIGREFGLSAVAVRQRLSRAVGRLRKELIDV